MSYTYQPTKAPQENDRLILADQVANGATAASYQWPATPEEIAARVNANNNQFAQARATGINPAVQAALDTKLNASEKGAAGGVAAADWAVNVAAYGASPAASAATNATAINTALALGGIVNISVPGTYDIGDTLIIKSRTTLILSPGVVLRRVGITNKSLLRNENATSADNTFDEDITILALGARIAINGNEGSTIDVYGFRSHLAFYNVRRLRIDGLRCTDLGLSNFFAQFANWEDVEVCRCYITGSGSVKDALHFNGGSRARIFQCRLSTYDDPLALNSWDYADLAPRLQPLTHVIVEQCVFEDPGTRVGFTARLLPGAWAAWANGTTYQLADTVNNGGYQYRKTNVGSVVASVAPTHTTTGQKVTGADGIEWACAGLCSFTTAEIEDIEFIDCRVLTRRAFRIAINSDSNGRSFFPGTETGYYVDRITWRRTEIIHPADNVTDAWQTQANVKSMLISEVKIPNTPTVLPSALVAIIAGTVQRLEIARATIPTWRSGQALVTMSSGASLNQLVYTDCDVTGRNDGANYTGIDGILFYGATANAAPRRILVRGGRYDWITALVRLLSDNTTELHVEDAEFTNVRRLYIGTAGTGTATVVLRGNRFLQAATLGFVGTTSATQAIVASIANNTFSAASTVISNATGSVRIRYSDAPVVTASATGAAAGDLVLNSSNAWQEYSGTSWGNIRN